MQQPLTDGRALRSQRTRASIVDATIALVESGELRPTGPRIAERAGVSVRSVYQHFSDLEALYAAVFDRMLDRVSHLLVPVDTSRPLRQRIDEFVQRRSELLEALTPLRRAADLHRPSSPVITDRMTDSQRFAREEVAAAFAPELAAADGDADIVLDALDLALCWPSWDALRTERGLSTERARAVVSRTVTALLM